MSFKIEIETIGEASVLMEALNALIEKGYAELSEIKAADANAIEQSRRWDVKLDSVTKLAKNLKNQINSLT